MTVCPNCGERNPERARFCMNCSSPLTVIEARTTRRTVTVVFSDLVGSTALGEGLDPEALREVLDRYFDEMKACLERHGGTVEKYIGDAVMAVFGIPLSHEDDAIRACLAATQMRERLASLNVELRDRWGVTLANRTGVFTGEVVAGDAATRSRIATGDAVNTAARLEQAAPRGEILIGSSTHRLVAHAVEVEPVDPVLAKGKSEPLEAFRLIAAAPIQAVARRADARMIGRGSERDALRKLYERTSDERRCLIAVVVGEAGVGKTRLVKQLTDDVRSSSHIVGGRCLPYGDAMTYWAMTQAVREGAGIGEDDPREVAIERLARAMHGSDDAELVVGRLATALGLGVEPHPHEELRWAFRRFAEHLGRRQPLVLVIDDLQWGEPALLDTITHVGAFAQDTAILIVCMARPELLERTEWQPDPDSSLTVVLPPLGPGEVRELARELLGASGVFDHVITAVELAAQGNPLFVEQLLAMWEDEGGLRKDAEGWHAARTGELPIPDTIHALIAARLDRLDDLGRLTLECGSVVGQVFEQRAVEALAATRSSAELDDRYSVLRARRFVRPETSVFLDEHAWAFVHLLVRDVAYEGMLKRDRSKLHERFADWLAQQAGDRIAEVEEIVAYHLEQAFRLRAELGPLDDQAIALEGRATMALETSARRALARWDHQAAATQYEHAAALTAVDSFDRNRLLVFAMESAGMMGDYARADALLAESEKYPAQGVVAARRRSISLAIQARRRDVPLVELLDGQRQTAAILREASDGEGLAQSLLRQAGLLSWMGNAGAARDLRTEAAALARQAGRIDLELKALTDLMQEAMFDSSDLAGAVELCERQILEHADDRPLLLGLLRPLAIGRAMQGRFTEARQAMADMKRIQEEIGLTPMAHVRLSETIAYVEEAAGDPAALEEALRPGYEVMMQIGETATACSAAAMLAHALVELGRTDEALALASESRRMATRDDYDAEVRWRMARGRALASAADYVPAQTLVREAIALADSTEEPGLQGLARLDLAHVLRSQGSEEEAIAAATEAVALFQRKGHLAGVELVQRDFQVVG